MKDFPFVESILRQVFNLKDDSAIFASTSLEQTNESGTPEDVAFSLFAQHERTLTGASPQTALIVGRLQPKARVSAARWNLKEAGGKRLAR